MTTTHSSKSTQRQTSGRSSYYRRHGKEELARVRTPNAFVVARMSYGAIL